MTNALDETHDPARRSWVKSANLAETDFPIQNLPLGIFAPRGGAPRGGIAIGDMILDIGAALDRGWFSGEAGEAAGAARGQTLNALLAMGNAAARALRRQAAALLDENNPNRVKAEIDGAKMLHAAAECALHLPVDVRNYTDFFAGIHHARTAGALMRPDNPLPPNYKHMPIAYHGRASSVCVSGSEMFRPNGQYIGSEYTDPVFGPCQRLDVELEMGFLVGPGNARGTPIPVGAAGDHIFGALLLNDWSARDIQRWEMMPLGPFLGKNFGTTISPWIITEHALLPFRSSAMTREEGDPRPLPYLVDAADQAHGGFDIGLAVALSTERMRAEGRPAHTIIRSNARYLYWTPAQMIAHHTSGGCNLQPGDLIGSGTISGPTREELSSLLELTSAGQHPCSLPNGETRGFVEDGDEITFTARCNRTGFASIGFGSCQGRVASAKAYAVSGNA
jgi:fumarylacetoacetase